jgi:hypothetical protein
MFLDIYLQLLLKSKFGNRLEIAISDLPENWHTFSKLYAQSDVALQMLLLQMYCYCWGWVEQ